MRTGACPCSGPRRARPPASSPTWATAAHRASRDSPPDYAGGRRGRSGTRCSPTPSPVVGARATAIDWLVDQERFEEAATVRDRLGAFLRGASPGAAVRPARGLPGAGRGRGARDDGGWELVLRALRPARGDRARRPAHGPAARRSPRCRPTGEHVEAPVAPATGGPSRGDRPRARRGSSQPGVRLVEVDRHVGVPGAVRAGTRRPGERRRDLVGRDSPPSRPVIRLATAPRAPAS